MRLVLGLSLSLTTAEFIEVQALSVEDLRKRFGLAASCQPSVTAVATDPAVNRISVGIECRDTPASPPPPPGIERSRPRGPRNKGS